MKKMLLVLLLILISFSVLNSKPKKDKGVFIDYNNVTWDTIRKEINEYEKKETPKQKTFIVDFSEYNLPNSLSEFKSQWHNDPVMQSSTGTCWCFSGTSFLESDVYRQTGKKFKFSEMFTVYWEYIEKVRRFVHEHGNSAIGEGSESNAVMRIWKKYGCVPEDAYTGKKPGQKHHNHSKMFNEIKIYLDNCKTNNIWDEELILSNVKSILNYYMGIPPAEFIFNNKKTTPLEFQQNEVKINLDDYVDIISLLEYGFGKSVVYDVQDNWWKSEYKNVSLDEYIDAIKTAIKNGFTLAIGGDVSETGLYSFADAAIIPTFDIPSESIDDYARQFRFSNGTTGDDHGIHIVGYTEKDGITWFLIKDSGSGARNGKFKGYYMYSEDYVKLKMIDFTAHKDAVPEFLKKIK
jgi:bleomycin hydrolase